MSFSFSFYFLPLLRCWMLQTLESAALNLQGVSNIQLPQAAATVPSLAPTQQFLPHLSHVAAAGAFPVPVAAGSGLEHVGHSSLASLAHQQETVHGMTKKRLRDSSDDVLLVQNMFKIDPRNNPHNNDQLLC